MLIASALLAACADLPDTRDKLPSRFYRGEDSTNNSSQLSDEFFTDNQLENRVDLSPQFASCVSIQKGGSCHVFSSVALLEAACYRRLKAQGVPADKAHLDLSEARVFAEHLKQKYENVAPKDLNLRADAASFTPYDGGDAYQNLVAMTQKGEACTESQIPFGPSFEHSLDSAKVAAITLQLTLANSPAMAKDSAFYKEAFQKSFCQRMTNYESCDESSAPTPEEQKLRLCINQWSSPEPKTMPYTDEDAIRLLNKGIPFICSGYLQLGTDGTIGSHATTIVGYQRLENTSDRSKSDVTWFIRDSNYPDIKTNWQLSKRTLADGKTVVGCNRIIYLE